MGATSLEHDANLHSRTRPRTAGDTGLWKVEYKHVRINAAVVLHLITVDATYHRFNGFDEQVDWIFDSVLPPEGAV